MPPISGNLCGTVLSPDLVNLSESVLLTGPGFRVYSVCKRIKPGQTTPFTKACKFQAESPKAQIPRAKPESI